MSDFRLATWAARSLGKFGNSGRFPPWNPGDSGRFRDWKIIIFRFQLLNFGGGGWMNPSQILPNSSENLNEHSFWICGLFSWSSCESRNSSNVVKMFPKENWASYGTWWYIHVYDGDYLSASPSPLLLQLICPPRWWWVPFLQLHLLARPSSLGLLLQDATAVLHSERKKIQTSAPEEPR